MLASKNNNNKPAATFTSVLFTFFLAAGVLTHSVQACTPSPGTYCPSPTGTAAACPAGYYCTGDAQDDHTACPVGTYNGGTGSSAPNSCQTCAVNMVALSTGQSACQPCQAGTFYSAVNTCSVCAAGTTSTAGSTQCTGCLAGSASSMGSGSCSTCRPGSFSSVASAPSCTLCPSGTYTFTTTATGGYSAVWGATSITQCLSIPNSPAAPLVCLPGTRMVGAACLACPIGYYCPQISQYPNTAGQVRACPQGSMSQNTGAIAATDCVVPSILLPFSFAECGITPGGGGGVSILTSLNAKAMTVSLDTATIFFATSTAVYRLFLQSNTLELLAGQEGTSASPTNSATNAIGSSARFTQITAIGVDLDLPEASVVVVGDGSAIRLVDVYTRQVTLLGAIGDVASAGGIALRRDTSSGIRYAYVSDALNHRIEAFNIDSPSQTRLLVAGDIGGTPGYTNAFSHSAAFNAPRGLAFLEHAMNSSRMLLVADSNNGVIRVVDTLTLIVSTWFSPLDTTSPEMTLPIGVAVSNTQDTIVYVADGGKQQIDAIQFPIALDHTVKVLTPLVYAANAVGSHFVAAVPYGSITTGSSNTAGYSQLLVLDGTTNTLSALVQDMLANSADGGGSVDTCHLTCQVSGCAPLSATALCGNSFLDEGEQCDNPNPGSGCFSENCTLKTGAACPVGQNGVCLDPCPAYHYAYDGNWYCAADCAVLTPQQGYTVDNHCVLTDIDECAVNTDTCHPTKAMCVNTQGSYECKCFGGYFGDGRNCSDVAYAVYTLIDIPSISSATLVAQDTVTVALMQVSSHFLFFIFFIFLNFLNFFNRA